MTSTNTAGGPRPRMPETVADALACPACGHPLTAADRGMGCAAGHVFNVAREGYVSLLTGATPPGTGDDKAMVADRVRFQQAGHYAPIGAALARVVARETTDAPFVVDVGGGTGHYLAHVLDALPTATGLTVDVSKFAARRAAKAHPRAGAVTADAWRGLPLRDGTVDALLNVFAPRNAEEFARVLAPGGILVVVVPDAGHLAELRAPLGLLSVDPRKDERLEKSLHGVFEPVAVEPLRFALALAREDVATVVGMGPSARHLDPADLGARIAALPAPVAVTASTRLHLYRPR
ncbi:putative RNA methyltransferase [Nocardiopsis lambiniae]|uniref:Methyltransferase domain-containing protein n=1 Tax=Nocardiopsis lambiniae TaxID=3075539 RepID=A0ABU2MC21_9ACTN|nr:methyltransferase domain-containing protein [Nocardiopsis sp. DSM 44743]MDT0330157.1 methyltransferase domain-containing protein [Nocardiopsis sp. DSM 44743]